MPRFVCDDYQIARKDSELSEHRLEKSEMSIGAFTAETLRTRVAPPGSGVSVKDRIRIAARRLGWSYTRTKDVWYADPRISISGDELRDIEEISGVIYGRAEARSLEQLIAKADALLESGDTDFYRPFRDAVRSFFRNVAGSRASGE
jgi:hypothetical protein